MEKYEIASGCAILVEDHDKAFQYARKAILNGSSTEFLKQKII